MPRIAKTINLGEPPQPLRVVMYVLIAGLPLFLCFVFLVGPSGSIAPLVAGLFGGLFPVAFFGQKTKELKIDSLQIPNSFIQSIDNARREAGLRWLRVSYLPDNELPYPIVIGVNLTLSPVVVNNYTSDQIGWAIRSGAKNSKNFAYFGVGFLWSLALITMLISRLERESGSALGLLCFFLLYIFAGAYFGAKQSELAADRWATRSDRDQADAKFVLGFALARQLMRDKSERFIAIPPYELRTRAKHLRLEIE